MLHFIVRKKRLVACLQGARLVYALLYRIVKSKLCSRERAHKVLKQKLTWVSLKHGVMFEQCYSFWTQPTKWRKCEELFSFCTLFRESTVRRYLRGLYKRCNKASALYDHLPPILICLSSESFPPKSSTPLIFAPYQELVPKIIFSPSNHILCCVCSHRWMFMLYVFAANNVTRRHRRPRHAMSIALYVVTYYVLITL